MEFPSVIFPPNGTNSGHLDNNQSTYLYYSGRINAIGISEHSSEIANETRPVNTAVRYLIRALP